MITILAYGWEHEINNAFDTYFSSKILIISLTSYPSGKYLPYIKYANIRLFMFAVWVLLWIPLPPFGLSSPSAPTFIPNQSGSVICLGFVCSVILEEEGTVLIWSRVWSEISVLKTLSKESYCPICHPRQLLADFCSDFLRACWDIFIQLCSTVKIILILWDRKG